jgi:hypothetical protein
VQVPRAGSVPSHSHQIKRPMAIQKRLRLTRIPPIQNDEARLCRREFAQARALRRPAPDRVGLDDLLPRCFVRKTGLCILGNHPVLTGAACCRPMARSCHATKHVLSAWTSKRPEALTQKRCSPLRGKRPHPRRCGPPKRNPPQTATAADKILALTCD